VGRSVKNDRPEAGHEVLFASPPTFSINREQILEPRAKAGSQMEYFGEKYSPRNDADRVFYQHAH
jgi:hypothetical protein